MKKAFCSKELLSLVGIISITLLSGFVLVTPKANADNDTAISTATISVPVSCSLAGTVTQAHTANEIPNGTYRADIGITTLKTYCNDDEGFAIYAVGYSDDTIGNTYLRDSTLGQASDILTGTASSGNNSAWAMKLAATSGTYAPIVVGSAADTEATSGTTDFSSYAEVPSRYTKVVYRNSATDMPNDQIAAEGAGVTTTYATYVGPNQNPGTYVGKVKYTLVHPSSHAKPIINPATLDTGQTVNSKLKSLAATVVNGADTTIAYTASDNYVKSIEVHLETATPTGFTPTTANTISTSTSKKPVYIVFDNTNDAGIMHFYTEGDQIALSSDSSYMFYELQQLSEISGISDWDTSSVTIMYRMFYNAGRIATTFTLDLSSWDTSSVTNMSGMFSSVGQNATTWSIGDLSSWDTSKVTDMPNMFYSAGYSATTWSIGDLSSWDTSKVTSMSSMFRYAGYNATTFTLDLSSWDTSSVTDMRCMFQYAGYKATTWSIGDLSSWNTSSVTRMGDMFSSAGYSATTWSIGDLSSWDTSKVTNMSGMFQYAGYNATTFTLNLSSWNTSSVTNMSNMFNNAGYSATTWSVTIPQTNGDNISNTTSRLYGKTTSTYGTPLSGKSFTLAQP